VATAKPIGQQMDSVGLSRSLAKWANSSSKPTAHNAKATPEEISHLVSRTTFGGNPQELEVAASMGASQWIDYQLDFQAIDNGFPEDLLAENFPTLTQSYAEILDALDNDQEVNTAVELIIATLVRQLFSPRQLYELMVEFWTNHFNVFLLDGPVQYLKTGDDRDNIRPHALGRFRDLLHANARSPAMLFYLDNVSNTNAGPNENYARELMELHTLGVDGGYDEGDVKEVARAFTGWTLRREQEDLFFFEPGAHDFESKFILGELLPAGQGIEDGNQVLDTLAAHPSTARFVSTKLCRRFVSDDPPESIVDKVADVFMASDGDIQEMMRVLLNADEFYQARGAKFKRPMEHLGSVLRGLESELNGDFLRVLFQELERQNQIPFFAEPPTGYPDQSESWLNSNALLSRWNFGFAVAFGDVPVRLPPDGDDAPEEPRVMSDLIELPISRMLGAARTPEQIVDQLIEVVLHQSLHHSERNSLVEYASRGAPANRPLNLIEAIDRARAVVAALLASPAFQNR
jgi:uncharacterized protein (DUF1800 family)